MVAKVIQIATRTLICLTVITLWLWLLYTFFPSETVNEALNTPLASLTLGTLAGAVWLLFLWAVFLSVLTYIAVIIAWIVWRYV